MQNQTNMYYAEPDLTQVDTSVVAVRAHAQGCAIATQENIVRATGGGEPRDHGHVNDHTIVDVEKHDGMTWLVLDVAPGDLPTGTEVTVTVDAKHRDARRRLHTALHLAIRTTMDTIGSTEVLHADVAEDAAAADLVLRLDRSRQEYHVAEIDRSMRSVVLQALPVTAVKAKNVEAAEYRFGSLFRVSDRHSFKGRIRVILVDGFDANPCSGLHHSDTDIGPYALSDVTAAVDTTGAEELRLKITLTKTWMYWYGDRPPTT